jgi:isocitrate/isopropylmalate dehydrogenase
MLTYEISDSFKIVGYSDSDFVGCLDTNRSTLGYVFKLTGGAISWSSSKQTVMTSSTIYAKFVACYEAMGQAMWLKKFVSSLRVIDSIERPLKLYCNNEPAILYAHINKKIKAAKHIDIIFYVVKENLESDY